MTQIVGGLRARLLRDSLYHMIDSALDDLGWYGTSRASEPVVFVAKAFDDTEQIPINTLALSMEDIFSSDEELGSNMAEHRHTFYLDFYAEDGSTGIELRSDLAAVLEGRLPSIGRVGPHFDLYDYTVATPTVIKKCFIEDVVQDRARNFPKPWQKHWYVVYFAVSDFYGSEDDA